MAKEPEKPGTVVYALQSKKPKGAKDRTDDTPQPPNLRSLMDQCQWVGPYGRCLLRATSFRNSWVDEDGVVHWKWCTWHGNCVNLHWHGNDFTAFSNWRSGLSRTIVWNKYTAESLFDLTQGKLRQAEYADGHGPEDNDPGRMLPPHQNAARLRDLIAKFGG